MEKTRRTKCALFAFMLLQLALPSWSVIADARSLGPAPMGDVHIEANGCTPSHPLDCKLCSFLRAPADLSAGLPELPLPGTAADSPPLSAVSCAAAAPRRSPLPRGPPA